VTFTDGEKSKFYGQYLSKLLVGNIIEFNGYSKNGWV